jgi:hypothetical protein
MNRYSMGMTIDRGMVPALRVSLAFTLVYILLHILAVIYTARHSSKKLWAIISGPGLYLVFIPIMLYILPRDLVRRKRTLRQ